MSTVPDPFTGSYAPVGEEVTAFDLPVTGTIPAELNGRYLRNGPNGMRADDPRPRHLFAGYAMVHGVRLREGRARWYRNRMVRSAAVAEALGERPRPGASVRILDVAPNTHVIGHADRTFALVEGGFRPYELSYEIETVGATDFCGTLPDGFAAHPKLDPLSGELHAITWQRDSEVLRHLVLSPRGRVIRAVDVPLPHRPVVHDMALTRNHAVILDLSASVGTRGNRARRTYPAVWDESRTARIGLLPRDGTGVRWFDVDPCFVFHTLNAYEDGDRVVIDVVRYPRMFAGGAVHDQSSPTLDRWLVDTASGKVTETRLDDRPQEFPAVSPAVVGGAHRYGYSTVATGLLRHLAAADALDTLTPEAAGDALIKHDLGRQTSTVRHFGAGRHTGEVSFVPREGARAEDDGYLLAYVHDPERGASDLVVLSAEDFTGAPVATVHLPVRVPAGFHGSWIPDPV
ncbi:carotenoid oxygenase family protein [Kitasatospora sp. SUK 42]|uniref:carotenoid oxygenase family protein n=1 Tax=Kitasatospora sp. SUK 42 TaxID=1588882 RepID=UPI0018C8DA74|nr:carotenoid oxygenase family protein [Kitasatospora sp. SUK 42]MBV2155391.1 carotenoid oxygenase family protein [Kitasatospora sp. SUK 42]